MAGWNILGRCENSVDLWRRYTRVLYSASFSISGPIWDNTGSVGGASFGSGEILLSSLSGGTPPGDLFLAFKTCCGCDRLVIVMEDAFADFPITHSENYDWMDFTTRIRLALIITTPPGGPTKAAPCVYSAAMFMDATAVSLSGIDREWHDLTDLRRLYEHSGAPTSPYEPYEAASISFSAAVTLE